MHANPGHDHSFWILCLCLCFSSTCPATSGSTVVGSGGGEYLFTFQSIAGLGELRFGFDLDFGVATRREPPCLGIQGARRVHGIRLERRLASHS
ncbi:hypothetical protein C8J57DRAFT_1391111, partial [Mycena rebaudengoi]